MKNLGKLMDVLQNGSIFHTPAEGNAFRKGPRCDGCEYEWGPMSQGVMVKLPPAPDKSHKPECACPRCNFVVDFPLDQGCTHSPGCRGHEECAVCGQVVHLTSQHGPRQTGKLRLLFPSEHDEIADNPYLTPTVKWIKPEDCPEWFTLPLTDAGNAKRLCLLFGWQMRYVHGWGWLAYDGRRWLLDTVGAVMRYAKQTVEAMVQSLEDAPVMDKTAAKEFAAHAFRSGSAGKLQAMISLAESEPDVTRRVQDFDQFPWLICVRNGIVDTTTGHMVGHDPELNITQLVNIEYHPEAQCPRWLQFLEEIFLGDQPYIQYFQRAVGYTLTGETSEEKLFFLYGDGANGKSTVLETLRHLMGDYALHMPFEAFLNNGKIKVENAFANLPGRRFVTATEAGEMKSFNEPMLKAITGRDTVTGEHKYQPSFNFKPQAKFWLAANTKPAIRGNDEGIWRRFALMPMMAEIPAEKRDPRLAKALEDELQGILAWAVRGSIEWWRNRPLAPSAVMTDALLEYRTDNDSFGRFMADTFDADSTVETSSKTILQEQMAWAKKNNEFPLNQRTLAERLAKWKWKANGRATPLVKKRDGHGRASWVGLRLVNSHQDGEGGAKSGLDRYESYDR